MPVIAGLTAGAALIVIFSMLQLTEKDYYHNFYGSEKPRIEYHFTNSGLVALDTHRIEDNDYNRHAINTILRNSTIVQVLEGERWVVFGIGGESHCSFGSCTVSRLDSSQNRGKIIHLFMDSANDRVVSYWLQ